jgi:hypothetical protein
VFHQRVFGILPAVAGWCAGGAGKGLALVSNKSNAVTNVFRPRAQDFSPELPGRSNCGRRERLPDLGEVRSFPFLSVSATMFFFLAISRGLQ